MPVISSQLGRDQFMQLLVTQLTNQDPMDPVNQQDFLGQLAQFSTLEGIENLNGTFGDILTLQNLTQGASLLGTEVEYSPTGSDTPVRGVVDAIRNVNGQIQLQIGDDTVAIGQVLQVTRGE